MKKILLITGLIVSFAAPAQQDKTSTVQVKFYMPVHQKNLIAGNESLSVFLLLLKNPDTLQKKSAKKIKENIYEFQLPRKDYWVVGFQLGSMRGVKYCIQNENGDAMSNYDFTVLLEKGKFDNNSIKFLPPCIQQDEEETEQ